MDGIAAWRASTSPLEDLLQEAATPGGTAAARDGVDRRRWICEDSGTGAARRTQASKEECQTMMELQSSIATRVAVCRRRFSPTSLLGSPTPSPSIACPRIPTGCKRLHVDRATTSGHNPTAGWARPALVGQHQARGRYPEGLGFKRLMTPHTLPRFRRVAE